MIVMKDIYKRYPNGVTALNGISITINKGEFVYIVGPSGAGKSTFVKLMYREVKPSDGELFIDGTDLSKLKEKEIPFLRRNIGVIFQDFKLLPRLSVYENVSFALEVIEETPRRIRKQVMEVLDLVGLKNKARALPHQLSGGEQQRVAIARAIVNNPKLVIADEPTGNLDPETTKSIMNLIWDIAKKLNTAVVMATHDYSLIQKYPGRVWHIENQMLTEMIKKDDTKE